MSSLNGSPKEPSVDGVEATPGARKNLDLGALRERLQGESAPRVWRSLQEAADTPEFEEMVHREFPEQAATWNTDDVSRRRFLQLMSASLALGGLTACTRQPLEKIVPYVNMPEQIVPGKPLHYATSLELDGYAFGLLVESHMGRPTKIEGNPQHPASAGATDLFAQATILDLYDPARAENVRELGRIRTWEAFEGELQGVAQAAGALGGAGLRILSGTTTSPTMAHLRSQLLSKMPQARWHQYEPIGHHSARAGAMAAFGEPIEQHLDLRFAEVVVALDSDFLTDGPASVRYSREFFKRRSLRGGKHHTNRLYSLESTPTPSGTIADHRSVLSVTEIGQIAVAVAARLGVPGVVAPTVGDHGDLIDALVEDLSKYPGNSVVVAGRQAPIEFHVIANAINVTLGNIGKTVIANDPIEHAPEDQIASLRDLIADMDAGKVETLIVLEGNPVFDAPTDLGFRDAYLKVSRRIHLSLFENETSELSQWNLPAAHYLESWGDGCAFDGTVTLRQPLIEPLYGGRSALELVALIAAEGGTGEDLVKSYWQARTTTSNFDKTWRRWLHDGLIEDSSAAKRGVTLDSGSVAQAARELSKQVRPTADSLEIILRADPTIYDGRWANNSWLQECPKPITKMTWDNAALISPRLAQEKGLANEDLVQLQVDGRTLELPVWIHPGQTPYGVTISLGYGRTKTGPVGTGTGFDAYTLRPSNSLWVVRGGRIAASGGSYPLASTQMHSNMELEGEEAGDRHLVRTATLGYFMEHPDFAQHFGHVDESLSLMPDHEYPGHAWGLSVDLSACTGCNACVVACQSENNIPVVGKEQVINGREMHWIRIDRYYSGDLDEPTMHHQPVMCMHCEQAPCEVVCPVAATVHSDEGLNDMVYNRCVGTRYCSNNCPYKVRRFNFLKYNDTDTPVLDLLRNPDVTVRTRGVMEKCSYCVQRINYARNEAKREDRSIRDGDIETACEQACPSRAILFGDVNDPESRVSKAKAEPLNYGILTELGTRPRTTYLAKIRNPSGLLEEGVDAGHGTGHGSDHGSGHDATPAHHGTEESHGD